MRARSAGHYTRLRIDPTPHSPNCMATEVRTPFGRSHADFNRREIHNLVASAFAKANSSKTQQLTPEAARLKLQKIRLTIAGEEPSVTGEPSRLPGDARLFIGSSAHAADITLLGRLGIGAVLNCAPALCKDPVDEYSNSGISYGEIDAHDDHQYPLLREGLADAREFIEGAHAAGRGVIVHCLDGVNCSAGLAVAHLLLRDRRCLFDLFRDCYQLRPSILKNYNFQLQLCTLAARHGLLYESPYSSKIITDEMANDGEQARAKAEANASEGITSKSSSIGVSKRPLVEGDSVQGGVQGGIKPQPLTGNGEMAEDLARVACTTCSRFFALSVLARHQPICASRAAKDAARNAKQASPVASAASSPPASSSEVEEWLEQAGLLRVHGLLGAILSVASDLKALSSLSSETVDAAIAPVQLKPKSQKYKNLMSAMDKLRTA